jgi:cytoskeletal protein CcmA (bactofilin family)
MSRTWRILLALSGSAILVLATSGPALAQTTAIDTNDQIVINGRVVVPAGETVGTVVLLNGTVTIDGTADGDVFVANGDVTIGGTVTGNVTVMSGSVEITDGATIGGDLVTGTAAVVAPGATVDGRVRRVNADWVLRRATIVGALLAWIAVAVSTLVLGLLFLLVAPRGAEAIATTARTKTGPAIGWGFAMFFGIPIGAGLAIATLVGIPLGVGVLLALALTYAFAGVASAFALGRALVKQPSSRFVSFLAGWGILAGLSLLPFLGGLAWFAAMVFGLGSIAVAVWNARSAPQAIAAPATLPPPPLPFRS